MYVGRVVKVLHRLARLGGLWRQGGGQGGVPQWFWICQPGCKACLIYNDSQCTRKLRLGLKCHYELEGPGVASHLDGRTRLMTFLSDWKYFGEYAVSMEHADFEWDRGYPIRGHKHSSGTNDNSILRAAVRHARSKVHMSVLS